MFMRSSTPAGPPASGRCRARRDAHGRSEAAAISRVPNRLIGTPAGTLPRGRRLVSQLLGTPSKETDLMGETRGAMFAAAVRTGPPEVVQRTRRRNATQPPA